MNDKFRKLPEEKQQRIVNAGLKAFALYDYRHAVCDDIAAEAGISKGLLFHYFHNKKEFYMYLYEYSRDILMESIVDPQFHRIRDFFDLILYAAKGKLELLKRNPYLMEFSVRAFYSQNEDVSEDISDQLNQDTKDLYEVFISGLDLYKFKDDIDPYRVYQMMVWISDGYLNEKRREKKQMDLEEFMADFTMVMQMLRSITYKEEYR